MKFTEKTVAALDLPAGVNERLISDDEMTGLSVRLRRSAGGGTTKSWVYRYSVAGTHRKVTFDFVGHNLAAARKRAGDLQARVRLGADPAQDRAQTKADVQQTVEVMLRPFLTQKKLTLRPGSYREMERHCLKYLQPLHRTPLRLIAGADVSALYMTIATDSGRTTASCCLRTWSSFFAWCVRQGFIERNPAVAVERFPDRRRVRVLNAGEIRLLWEATAGADDFSQIVRLLLLSGCRRTEIGALQWDEIFSDRIVLPAERTKNKRAHMLPLTPTMRSILAGRAQRGRYVFGQRDDGPYRTFSRGKALLDARLEAAGGLDEWVLHDLRRTMATGLCELGTSPYVVELCLNHTGFRSGVQGRYNLAQLEAPMRHALNVWDQHIADIVAGRTTGDRVVPLRA